MTKNPDSRCFAWGKFISENPESQQRGHKLQRRYGLLRVFGSNKAHTRMYSIQCAIFTMRIASIKEDGEAGSINSDSIYMTELPHRMSLSQVEFRLFDVT